MIMGACRALFCAAATSIFVMTLGAASSSAQSASPAPNAATSSVGTAHVDATAAHELNSFVPDRAIGSSMDVLSHDVIDKIYTPAIMKEILSTGYGTISYRNNPELRSLAWHWNENGTWSDPAHKSGYFTNNPYLTSRFTGESDSLQPQWVILVHFLARK